MKIYIYFLILVFIIILVFKNLKDNFKYAPIKIKILCSIILIGILLRLVSLLLMLFVQNIAYIYILKWSYFLNLIYTPILALMILYILIRSNKLNFSYMFFVATALILMYLGFIYNCSVNIKLDLCCGYFMVFERLSLVYIAYMCLFVMFIAFCITYCNKITYKRDMFIFLVASIAVILEVLLIILNKGIFINPIIGDFLWLIALVFSLSKFKNPSRG